MRYEDLRLGDLRGRDVSGDVVIIPIAPCENHGTHLPLGTDIFISREVSRRVARIYATAHPPARVLIYPCITVASAAIRGTGSVKITSRQMRRALMFLCKRFRRQGYRRFAILSAHGGVPHAGAMDDVCRALSRQGARAVAPAAYAAMRTFKGDHVDTMRARGIALPDDIRELLRCDLHGGLMETSMMLAVAPDLVGDLRDVPPLFAKNRWWLERLKGAILFTAARLPLSGRTRTALAEGADIGATDLSWILSGRGAGYLGAPALATREIGDFLLEAVSADIAGAMDDVFDRDADPAQYRSSAWLFSRLKLIAAAVAVLIVALAALLLK